MVAALSEGEPAGEEQAAGNDYRADLAGPQTAEQSCPGHAAKNATNGQRYRQMPLRAPRTDEHHDRAGIYGGHDDVLDRSPLGPRQS